MPQLTAGAGYQQYDGHNGASLRGACANVRLMHLGTERPDYRFPTGGMADKTESYNAIEWSICHGLTSTPDTTQYRDAELTAAGVQVTDIGESDRVQRRLFFAGVFAGILGALAIEIFKGSFDVAEHWSARRRTRRDEQEQRPEPLPPPDPNDDKPPSQDRDQLRLP